MEQREVNLSLHWIAILPVSTFEEVFQLGGQRSSLSAGASSGISMVMFISNPVICYCRVNTDCMLMQQLPFQRFKV